MQNCLNSCLNFQEEYNLLQDAEHPFSIASYIVPSNYSASKPTPSTRNSVSGKKSSSEGFRHCVWSPSMHSTFPSALLLVITAHGFAFLYTKETPTLLPSWKIFFAFHSYFESLPDPNFSSADIFVKSKYHDYSLVVGLSVK
jgi:hypothetical protein